MVGGGGGGCVCGGGGGGGGGVTARASNCLIGVRGNPLPGAQQLMPAVRQLEACAVAAALDFDCKEAGVLSNSGPCTEHPTVVTWDHSRVDVEVRVAVCGRVRAHVILGR